VTDSWSYTSCKAPVKSLPPTNQHQVFLQARCLSCRPTNSVKALKGKISHCMDLLTPSSPGGLPTLSLTTNSSWLSWGWVAMPLISPLMPVLFGATDVDKTNMKLKIDDITLEQEECSKYLGVIIDSNLMWQNHSDYIYNKIIKFVGIYFIE